MAKKGLRKYKEINRSGLKTTLLLVQFILIKIGQAEIWILTLPWNILKLLVRSLQFVVKRILNFRFPNYQLPTFRHGRGRPRNKWFIPYYLAKLKIFIKKRISKKTKIVFVGSLFLLGLYFYTSVVLNTAYQLPS